MIVLHRSKARSITSMIMNMMIGEIRFILIIIKFKKKKKKKTKDDKDNKDKKSKKKIRE